MCQPCSQSLGYGKQTHPRNTPLQLECFSEMCQTCEAKSRVFEVDIADVLEYAERVGTLAEYEAERLATTEALRAGANSIESSSMGRLFDAVASLLGIRHVNRYEGECASMLENAAYRAQKAKSEADASEAERLALAFHLRVAEAVRDQCRVARELCGSDIVCISGGVFQNKILTEEVLRLLRADGFRVYYNELVPPNDGGIALGQNYIGMLATMQEA
jgi:hydrogenase maturation protein HypF